MVSDCGTICFIGLCMWKRELSERTPCPHRGYCRVLRAPTSWKRPHTQCAQSTVTHRLGLPSEGLQAAKQDQNYETQSPGVWQRFWPPCEPNKGNPCPRGLWTLGPLPVTSWGLLRRPPACSPVSCPEPGSGARGGWQLPAGAGDRGSTGLRLLCTVHLPAMTGADTPGGAESF